MSKKVTSFFILVVSFSCQDQGNSLKKPPVFPKEKVVYQYFGEQIVDPYANLENLSDTLVLDWFRKQERYSSHLLNKIPEKKRLFQKLKKASQKPLYITKKIKIINDEHFFYLKQKSGENGYKLYYKKFNHSITETLLYDPSQYMPHSGNNYVISYFEPSRSGDLIAIALSKKGEEISRIIIMRRASKNILPHYINNCDPSGLNGIQWLPDDSGFIYQFIPVTNVNDKSFYQNTEAVLYKIGTNPNQRHVVFSKKNNPKIESKAEDFPFVSIPLSSSNYMYAKLSGVNNYEDTFYASCKGVEAKKIPWKRLFRKTEKIKLFVEVDEEIIYLTARGASNFRICKTSFRTPDFENPEVLVEEYPDKTIIDFAYKNGTLFFTTLKNGVESRLFMSKNGKQKEIELPLKSGKSNVFWGKNYLYFYTQGWTSPKTLYSYNLNTKTTDKIQISSSVNDTEYKDVVIEEIEVESYDNQKIPLSILYKKDMILSGKNPTIILGYGAYGATYAPFFSTAFLTWISEGGVLAVAHVRGGGEKGEAWHKAGYKKTKKNTWLDAIACTEYLIKKSYTSSDNTVIYGISAGGIMLGKAITERPDLFKAAIGVVPSINLLRSEFQANGRNHIKEFGTVEDSTEFRALLEMDAYHHIKKEQEYPATLIVIGMKDQRVAPWDAAKFVARLQDLNPTSRPILLKVDFNSGHGLHDEDEKYNKEMAEIFSFAFWQTGHKEYQLLP